MLFKLKSSFLCFQDLVKRVQRDFGAEKVKPVLVDHWVNELIAFCNTGWMEFSFFPLQRIFRSSAKSVDWTENLIFSYMSFMAMGNSVTEIVEPWGTPFC